MDEKKINELTMELERALEADVTASLALIDQRVELAAVEALARIEAREAGEIDGKNAPDRADQVVKALGGNTAVQKCRNVTADAEATAAHAKVRSEVARARVGLYKAALYAQGGRTITLNA